MLLKKKKKKIKNSSPFLRSKYESALGVDKRRCNHLHLHMANLHLVKLDLSEVCLSYFLHLPVKVNQSRLLRKVIAETHTYNPQDKMGKQVDLTANRPPSLPQRLACFCCSDSTLLLFRRVCFMYSSCFFMCRIKLLGRPLTEPLVFLYNCSRRSQIHNSSIKMPYPLVLEPPSLHTLPPQPPTASRSASDLQSIIHDPTSSNHYCEEWDPVVPNSPPAGKRLCATKTGL